MNNLIEDKIIEYLETEFYKETSQTISMPLINNYGCIDNYIALICKINYKTCNTTTLTSKDLCSTVCDNFISTCGTYTDLCANLPAGNYYPVIATTNTSDCFT